MNIHRRDFLRRISSVAAVAASGSVLKEDAEAAAIQTSHLTGMHGDLELAGLRDQFPTLKERVNGHALVYLDSAATTQRPRAVIDALSNFYLHDNANPAKNLHTLARRCASLYEKARATVASFVHAPGPEEIIWTRGTTEALNLVASSWGGANASLRRRNHPDRIRTLLESGALANGCAARECACANLERRR